MWRIGVVVLAGILVYANSLSAPFIFDDEATIVENTSIRDLRSADVWVPSREAPTAGRPLVNVSFAINYALGGLNVVGYHVLNITLHIVCALLIFGCPPGSRLHRNDAGLKFLSAFSPYGD